MTNGYEAGSGGQCTFLHFAQVLRVGLLRRLPVQCFPRSGVEQFLNPCNLFVSYVTELGSLWEEVPNEPVGVFIATSLLKNHLIEVFGAFFEFLQTGIQRAVTRF